MKRKAPNRTLALFEFLFFPVPEELYKNLSIKCNLDISFWRNSSQASEGVVFAGMQTLFQGIVM